MGLLSPSPLVNCQFICMISETNFNLGASGMYLITFTMTVEFVGPKWKTFMGNAFWFPFVIGEAAVSLIAMLFTDWKTFQIATSAPVFLLLPLLYFALPESPRWQISVGKYEEARKTMEKAAKFNKVPLSPELLNKEKVRKEEEATVTQLGIKSLFDKPNVRIITIVLLINWALMNLGYYGVIMSSGNLNDNIFISYFLISLIGKL